MNYGGAAEAAPGFGWRIWGALMKPISRVSDKLVPAAENGVGNVIGEGSVLMENAEFVAEEFVRLRGLGNFTGRLLVCKAGRQLEAIVAIKSKMIQQGVLMPILAPTGDVVILFGFYWTWGRWVPF